MFPEIPEATLDALLKRLGKCREGWGIEESLLATMADLGPLVVRHRFEWETLTLALKVQQAHRKIEAAQSLAECYLGFGRLMRAGWRPILQDLLAAKEALGKLEAQLRNHLEARYTGAALEEWFAKVFTFPARRLEALLAAVDESIAAHERKPGFSSTAERDFNFATKES